MKLTRTSNEASITAKASLGISRRQFMKHAGITTGGIAAASLLGTSMMRRAEAKDIPHNTPIEVKRTVCTHCAVGCGLYAEVQNGVWTGQEPAFDHPFNSGGHCAKGAALREHGHGEKRLKYPMKLVDGKWKKISWEQAFSEVGDKMLDIRKESGPDSVYFMGSAKFSNEGCYMYRKFAAMWGTNNVDHSARICHSTTVAGVANTWGYGAQTNSFNDIQNSNAIFIIGANPAEAHPVSMQHILTAKEKNNAKLIVAEPRFTRTAAHADLHCAFRPGTDIPFIYGMLWHIFENGWEDKTFIKQRVFEMDMIRKEAKKFPPKEVANITGVSEEKVYQAAKLMADNRPGCVVWSMGGTQHHVGNANTRAYCILQLALGNMGVSGGGTNIFRGHDNVQGSTDFGLLFDSLPGYYGLSTGSWKHWANVWDLEFDWVQGRFDTHKDKSQITVPGIPCSRWHDGVLDEKVKDSQKDNIRMAFFWGQSVNTETRQRDVRDALDKMDTVVVVDPFPTMAGVMHRRKNGVYLLPAATQFETEGSVTNSGRSLQWREKVIEPLFESKTDLEIMYRLAQKVGIAEQYAKNIAKDANDLLVIEDITREFNRGMWTIGYTGQSPERIKLHTQNWGTFSNKTLEAVGGPAKGETYGLPWPCWGTPEQKHPGTQILYNTHRHVLQGGGNFRARYGVEYQGKNLLAEGSFSKGAEIQDGYPEFTADMLKQLGWWDELTAEEKSKAEGKNWKNDVSGGIQRVAMKHGCIPFGNAKARCIVWTFPDQVPVHREPLYTPRRDLVAKYPTYDDMQIHRLPTLYKSIQEKDTAAKYPLALTSGRLVEYEGGGEETRSNPWLAELQQEMFVEINPADAADRGIRNGDSVWLEGAEGGRIKIQAMVTPRVKAGVTWMPFHFAGVMHGESLTPNYPEGTVPYVIGESANTAMTYGYDPVTQMQETKASLCQITKA